MLSIFCITVKGQISVESNGNVDISGIVTTLKFGGENVTVKMFIGNTNSGFDANNIFPSAISGSLNFTVWVQNLDLVIILYIV